MKARADGGRRKVLRRVLVVLAAVGSCSVGAHAARAASADLAARVDAEAAGVEQQVIDWRRDIHAHPELGFQEKRTAALVARHLRTLGFDEVRTGVGRTGVVGILRGAMPGPVVALRADMDALPVEEQTGLPFASKVKASWNGVTVPVMHACGHDAHVAILMGVAHVLAALREQIPGTVMLLFQPAEEGAPADLAAHGGAEAMLQDGVFDDPTPGAIFGLHVAPMPSGNVYYRAGPTAAASDEFHIEVKGQGTHGAMPWGGSDVVSAAAQTVISLQSIVSRRIDLTSAPAMISVGSLHAGNRVNVIPPTADIAGTIRSFSEQDRELIHRLIPQIAKSSAENYGASATTVIKSGYPVLVNDPALGEQMLPALKAIAGDTLKVAPMGTGSEDFGEFAQKVPGFFFVLGTAAGGGTVTMNHSPQFTVDEKALRTGVVTMTRLSLAYLASRQGAAAAP